MSATLPFFPRALRPTTTPNPTSRTWPATAIVCQWTPTRRGEPVPARDRVIDFGKHKGKMLGAIPSKYLKWVAEEVRGSKKEWAQLADQVLADPVYRDRIEWEFLYRYMSGEGHHRVKESAADKLMEAKDRFGWDLEDRDGWSKIKYELLGTSHSGRIPKVKDRVQIEKPEEDEEEEEDEKRGAGIDEAEMNGRARRRERRRKETRVGKLGFLLEGRDSLGNAQEMMSGGGGGGRDNIKDDANNERVPRREGILGFSMEGKGTLGNAQEEEEEEEEGDRRRRVMESGGGSDINRRFPGREELLRRALNRRRFSS